MCWRSSRWVRSPKGDGIGLGHHGLQGQADLAGEEPGHDPHEDQQGRDAHHGKGHHHGDAAKQAATVLFHKAKIHLHQGTHRQLQLGVEPVRAKQRLPGLIPAALEQQGIHLVDGTQILQPLLLDAVEGLAFMLGPHGCLVGIHDLLHLAQALLDAGAANLPVDGIFHHQQGKLGTAHIGDVVEQVVNREHAWQGGVGEVQYPIPNVPQFGGEKQAEDGVDDSNDRKDGGNLLADGEMLVRHVGW